MNTFLFFIEIILCFAGVLIFESLFKKHGIFAWIAIATILANIQTSKQVEILGLNVTLGTVLFASVFLCTDILTEKYSLQDAKIGVYIGLISSIIYLLSSLLCILYIPNEFDYVNDAFISVFSFSPRICISSIVMFFLSNIADVLIFNKLKNRHRNKYLWIRNNVSTILCNCLENFFFIFFAFIGVYSLNDCTMIALGTCAIECIIALCDTPFLYASKYLIKGDTK